MAEDIRIDSHKLLFHPDRVADWKAGRNIYPLSVEISISGACNHRCQFCAFDYLGYKPQFYEKELLLANLQEMVAKGVKSVVFAGEGEPLLHQSATEIIVAAKQYGLDVAMSTNGVLFTENTAAQCMSHLTWIRFSVNGGSTETYHKVHGGRPQDFKTVLANLEAAVALKRRHKLTVTLGVQMLLIKDNAGDVVSLGQLLKKIGVDYYTVKPYSHHPKSINNIGAQFDYQEFLDLEHRLKALASDDFQVYFRAESMDRLKTGRTYGQCLGLPFWTFIDSRANVWACSAYLGDSRFCFGNLHDMSFSQLWEGENRRHVMEFIHNMNIDECRELCRLDQINAYLNQVKRPGLHVNFI